MRAPTLDLSLLRTLVAIADMGSVTAAARRLAYTQSTVSMQLSRLEASLGVTLHEKEGRASDSPRRASVCWATPDACWR